MGHTFTPEARAKISASVSKALQDRAAKRFATLPFDELPKHRRYDRMLQEQNGCCAICGISNIWNERPLRFHVDHILGKAQGDARENLRLLCPNCHSQTPTYGNKGASEAGKQRYREALRRGRQNYLKSLNSGSPARSRT